MIKRREKTKRENVHLGVEIFEKRYQARDFNGHILAEFTSSAVKSSRYYTFIPLWIKSILIIWNPRFSSWSRRPAFAPIYGNQYSSQQSSWTNASSQYHSLAAGNNASSGSAQINKRGGSDGDTVLANNVRKEKRQYKKRKHKNQRDKPPYPTPGNCPLISWPRNSPARYFCFYNFWNVESSICRTNSRCHGVVRWGRTGCQ